MASAALVVALASCATASVAIQLTGQSAVVQLDRQSPADVMSLAMGSGTGYNGSNLSATNLTLPMHVARKGAVVVTIGSNGAWAPKCVTIGNLVACDPQAGDKGNRVNTDHSGANDDFTISVDGYQVCATRHDATKSWGMNLQIECHTITGSPTALPTGSPTASPTGSPTASPTGSPTASPTGSPTASPTGSPTASPTGSPTASPTGSPTASPTGSPTASPTVTPEFIKEVVFAVVDPAHCVAPAKGELMAAVSAVLAPVSCIELYCSNGATRRQTQEVRDPTSMVMALASNDKPALNQALSSIQANGGLTIPGFGTFASTLDVEVFGDPHARNIRGERFDLHGVSNATLLRIPRATEIGDSTALLKVDARLKTVATGVCKNFLYIHSITIKGKWAEVKQKEGYYVGANAGQADPTHPHHKRLWKLGPKKIHLMVAHGITLSGITYLNFRAGNLGETGMSIGGLLGEGGAPPSEGGADDPACTSLAQIRSK